MATTVQHGLGGSATLDKPTPEELSALEGVVRGSGYQRWRDYLAQQRHNRQLGWMRVLFTPLNPTPVAITTILTLLVLILHFSGAGSIGDLSRVAAVIGGAAWGTSRTRR